MNSIGLRVLGHSEHPLLQGLFSIWNDPETKYSNSNDYDVECDIDGFCISSHALEAFKICEFGEARVYTRPEVIDAYKHMKKTNFCYN